MSAVGDADIRLDQPTVFSNIWRIIYRAAENGSVASADVRLFSLIFNRLVDCAIRVYFTRNTGPKIAVFAAYLQMYGAVAALSRHFSTGGRVLTTPPLFDFKSTCLPSLWRTPCLVLQRFWRSYWLRSRRHCP